MSMHTYKLELCRSDMRYLQTHLYDMYVYEVSSHYFHLLKRYAVDKEMLRKDERRVTLIDSKPLCGEGIKKKTNNLVHKEMYLFRFYFITYILHYSCFKIEHYFIKPIKH